jgi:hypothetical protein
MMLSDRQIEKNREALIAAIERINGLNSSSMVIDAKVSVCLFVGATKRINKQRLLVRFLYDKNWPKFHIEALEHEDFHTAFSVAWQQMTFIADKALLLVRGMSERAPDGYKLHLHVRRKRRSRGA